MNNLRYRSGQTDFIRLPTDIRCRYWAGDLICLLDGLAVPVSDFPDLFTGNSPSHCLPFHFVGVSHQSDHQMSNNGLLSVDISATSVYEFEVPTDHYDFGNLLAADTHSSQRLTKSDSYLAIAMAREGGNRVDRLRVSFLSAFNPASAGFTRRLKIRSFTELINPET